MGNISLTSAIRANLSSLQNIATAMQRTQNILSTGLKVSSATDNPTAYFTAKALNDRAADLSTVKDNIANGIQTLKAATTGIESIEKLVKQAKALTDAALATSDATERSDYATQFGTLRTQINELITDTGYNGVNLLNGDDLTVNFNEDASSTLSVTGVTYDAAGLGIAAAANNWAADADITAASDDIDAALVTLRTQAAVFGSNSGIVSSRHDFVKEMISVLGEGAGNLVNADMNEEAANMLALQTRQSLATQALYMGVQSQQSILSVFR